MRRSKSLSTSAANTKGVNACNEDQDKMMTDEHFWELLCSGMQPNKFPAVVFFSIQRKEGHAFMPAKHVFVKDICFPQTLWL